MSLSAEQQTAYEAYAKQLGIGNEKLATPTSTNGSTTVLSADPSEATIPPKIVSVSSLQELKTLIGRDDSKNDDHVEYPPMLKSMPAGRRKADLNHDEIHSLKKIANAYLFGNSAKIAQDHVDSIESAMFPTKTAVYTAENFTVKKGDTLTIKKGVTANYGILTVEEGGLISVEGDATLNCQQFIQQ